MKLFTKKREESRSRRNDRLWLLRYRKFGLWLAVCAFVGSAGFAGYRSASFKTINHWIVTQTLERTAEAGFKVKDILVTGREQIPSALLLEHLSIKQNMPIFGVSIGSAQRSLMDIPWVKDVSISRRLPDKVIVELKERVPVALWQYQKKISVIDEEGVILTTNNLDLYQQLPLVVGVHAAKHVAELVDLLHAEPSVTAELVSAVRIGERRWDLHLKNNITVKLPEHDVELALRQLARAGEQKNLFGRNIVSIDLRQPEKMIVTPVAILNDTTDKKNKKTI